MTDGLFMDLTEHPKFVPILPPYVCLNCARFERCLELFNQKRVTLCSMAIEKQRLHNYNAGVMKND